MLYVHGIGTHVPGRRHLAAPDPGQVAGPRRPGAAAEADRDRAARSFPDQNLGEINVTRLTDEQHERDLLFYELTWSPITQPDKDLIAFDKEQDYVLRRAAVNQAMRSFVNDIAPDPLAYAGQKREPILVSVDPVDLLGGLAQLERAAGADRGPVLRPGPARLRQPDDARRLRHRQPQPGQPGDARCPAAADQRPVTDDPGCRRVADQFKHRDLQLFMLSNQLPLLEAGREGQQVTGQVGAYCGPGPTKPGRFFAKTELDRLQRPERPDELPGARTGSPSATSNSRLCPR